MNETTVRLTKCFTTVFPNLRPEEAESATQESVAAWDSVATLNLLNLIDEEFGVAIDYEQLENLTSFRCFEEYLAERLRH